MSPIAVPAPWRGLLAAAALILTGTALLHTTAYPSLTSALADWDQVGNWGDALEGLWLMFAAHLVVLSAFLLTAAFRPRYATDSALLVCALLLAVDTGLLIGYMGVGFVGSILVGVSTVLVIVARAVRPATSGSDSVGR